MPKVPHGARCNTIFAKEIVQAYLKDQIFVNFNGYLYDVEKCFKQVKLDIQDGYYSISITSKR